MLYSQEFFLQQWHQPYPIHNNEHQDVFYGLIFYPLCCQNHMVLTMKSLSGTQFSLQARGLLSEPKTTPMDCSDLPLGNQYLDQDSSAF